jgi:hypothetical protein
MPSRGRPPSVSLVRDLCLTDLRAVLIVDDKDIEAVLTMLHYIRGDNQDVGSDAGLLPGVDEIPSRWGSGLVQERSQAPIAAFRDAANLVDLPGLIPPGTNPRQAPVKTKSRQRRTTKSRGLAHLLMLLKL